MAEEVWWCELGDELCEFGSGGRTHPRAGPVNVALDGSYRQSERFGYLNVGQTAPVGPILWCNPTSAPVTLFFHQSSAGGEGGRVVDDVGAR